MRVPDDRWDRFAFVVGARNRSAFLNDVMDLVNEDPQLWRDVIAIAQHRDDSWHPVVLSALRRWVARNRHLLDDVSRPPVPAPTRPDPEEATT